VYVPLEGADNHKEKFDLYWGEKRDAIQRVINLFSNLNTRHAEIIATLYTAWNDLLLAGEQPDDDAILRESRDQWHEAKQKITPE
jgi:type I restriction enzyme, S subunit